MSASQIDELLQSGITSLKSGDKQKAKALFLEVIDLDENNEKAWLWLSAVVERADQIICLENVLTINPNNERAKKGLARLGALPSADERQIVRRERAPLSGAEAILYPERQVMEWEWVDPTSIKQGPEVGYGAHSSYEDVWTQNVDLCPYCAMVTTKDDKRCGGCKRPLYTKRYRYPKMSSRVHMFWVFLFGLANINLIQLFIDIIYWQDIVGVLINLTLIVVFFILGVGAIFRKMWSFIGAQIVLIALLLVELLNFLFPIQVVRPHILPQFDQSIRRFVIGVGGGFDTALDILEISAAVFALFMAIVFLAPDFEKVTYRLVAKAREGLAHGADYHLEATRMAEMGLWATAVLNWQRAAAKEPTRIVFQQKLADGYLRLNFFQRSLDVLQSALKMTTIPEKKAAIQQQIETVKAAQIKQQQEMEQKN